MFGVRRKLAKRTLNKITDKLNNLSLDAQYQLMKKTEQIYLATGKVPSEKMQKDRTEAIKYLKDKGFLCKFIGCEEKAKINGYCEKHN